MEVRTELGKPEAALPRERTSVGSMAQVPLLPTSRPALGMLSKGNVDGLGGVLICRVILDTATVCRHCAQHLAFHAGNTAQG